MPFEIDLDSVNHCVRSRTFGTVTNDDLLAHVEIMREFFETTRVTSNWTQIADLNGTSKLESLTAHGLRQLANRNPWPLGCWRAIVTHDDLGFGLARMYQLLGEEKGDFIGVFRSEDAAWEWVRQEKPDLSDYGEQQK